MTLLLRNCLFSVVQVIAISTSLVSGSFGKVDKVLKSL
jgi:hypothetical protein